MKQDTSGPEEGEICVNPQVSSISSTGTMFMEECMYVCVRMNVCIIVLTYIIVNKRSQKLSSYYWVWLTNVEEC